MMFPCFHSKLRSTPLSPGISRPSLNTKWLISNKIIELHETQDLLLIIFPLYAHSIHTRSNSTTSPLSNYIPIKVQRFAGISMWGIYFQLYSMGKSNYIPISIHIPTFKCQISHDFAMISSKPMKSHRVPMENGPPPCARPRSVAPARGGAAPSGADDLWPGPGLGISWILWIWHGMVNLFGRKNPKKKRKKRGHLLLVVLVMFHFFWKKPRMKLRIQGWGWWAWILNGDNL